VTTTCKLDPYARRSVHATDDRIDKSCIDSLPHEGSTEICGRCLELSCQRKGEPEKNDLSSLLAHLQTVLVR
jgi:hypothetical protein